MSIKQKSVNRKVTVSRTKIPNAPWEEDRYIYDIKTGNDSIWSDNAFVIILQIIVGIVVFVWTYNSL